MTLKTVSISWNKAKNRALEAAVMSYITHTGTVHMLTTLKKNTSYDTIFTICLTMTKFESKVEKFDEFSNMEQKIHSMIRGNLI